MKKEEHYTERTGKDRWLVSYADFITLLFAFLLSCILYLLLIVKSIKVFLILYKECFQIRLRNLFKLSQINWQSLLCFLRKILIIAILL